MQFSPDEIQLWLSAIVETSDDGIIGKNLDGVVQSWNKAAERIFGYTAEEMVGKPILILIPSERKDEEPAILKRLQQGERVDHFQTVRRRKDGTLIEVSVTISPIKDRTNKVIGASKIVRDVTSYLQLQRERDQLLAAERAARGEAERASRSKDEFIATLSHELRTPLSAIMGWTHLISRSPSDAEAVMEGIEIIERNAKAQTQLIEDLLDMGRIMSGKIRLDVQRLDIPQLIENAVASIRPAAEARRITLHTILDPRAGPVSGDPNRLQQVVWNLLTNAVKFTPNGGKIQVLLTRVNSHIEITVHDSGKGIKPDFLPFVFDRFRQADSSITREHGGLGLGLAIVKHLVELHGGRVRVKSAGEGLGAAFSVELPLTVAADIEPSASDNGNPSALMGSISLCGATILLVDDEADARQLLCRILQQYDANVIPAGSADLALQALADLKPDVVISDIGMPQKDGYEFMREVRRMPRDKGGRVPSIALTALARPEDRTRAMMSGFQVHIAKPVDPRELVAAVASLLGRTG